MRYIDSSSLLKLLWTEPDSAAVRTAVEAERQLIVSSLAELEVEVRLRARWLGDSMTLSRYRAQRAGLTALRDTEPFEFRPLPGDVFRVGIAQAIASKSHCRSLDRLHLAAMQVLGVTRLLTNDAAQADAARAMGYDVVTPR